MDLNELMPISVFNTDPDDMKCTVCKADVYDVELESFTLTYWNPSTQSNEFVAVFCGKHNPIRKGN